MIVLQHDMDSQYQQFNLKENELLKFCQEKDIDGLAHSNYFIFDKKLIGKKELIVIDKNKYFRLQSLKCKFASCALLSKHGLSIGSYSELLQPAEVNQNYLSYLLDFKNNIIDTNLFWVVKFLQFIQEFLQTRNAEKVSLLNKESVQLLISEIIINIKFAEQCRNYTNNLIAENIAEYQAMAIKNLKLATQALAKLHGGKSLLSGNIIEMMMIFEYFRDIYFH